MIATAIAQQGLFGLFQLDENGVVLYSRVEGNEPKIGMDTSWIGNNFFDAMRTFDTGDQIREQITSFARSPNVAARFLATFKSGTECLAVKVLLARIRDRCRGEYTKSVLVHIKRIG